MSFKHISIVLSIAFLWAAATAHAQIAPALAVLGPSQQQQFSVQQTLGAPATHWMVVPPQAGRINATGLYTAPSSISATEYATVYVQSGSDLYQAQVQLNPSGSGGSGPPISVSVSPTFAYVYAGQSTAFNALVSGTADQQVAWSITQGTGSVVNGTYTAPSSVSSDTLVTISAISLANPAKTASATILVSPTPITGGGVSPSTATVAPSGTQQFSVQTLPLGVIPAWSISPAEGSISASGLYSAPTTTVATQVSITVTATNSATGAVLGTANLILEASPAPSVSPATATVAPGGTQQFSIQNLPSGADVSWSISPKTGHISMAGLYSAPDNVAAQTTITVTATNSSADSVLGSASLTLQASPAPSVSPATATVAPAGTQQFSVQNLPSGDSVTWSISPGKGSISTSGLYSAPSYVASQASITVSATNSSTSAVLGTASLTLQASPAPSVSPATATVAPAGTQQFSVQNLPSGASVTWSISPATGGISTDGLYTAPSDVTSQTTVTVTATNSSTNAVFGTASLTLRASPTPKVSPAKVTLAPAGTQQFSVKNLPSGDSVTWSISPTTGSISTAGLYTAPSSVASQTIITVTATNSSTNAVLGTATLTLQTKAVANIVLPIEVFGTNATTVPVSFTIPSGASVTGQLELWLQIHGLEYQAQASVQVNSGAWLPINDTTATYLGQANTFGGLGGGFSTLTLTMKLPSGSVQAGQNTMTFRFNGTDGVSSGFRVLAMNILASGSRLIPATSFTQDEPTTWTPPLSDPTDIQAGQTLWQTANLSMPLGGPIQAKCGSCHTVDGRDLKYFNYSNASIEARSVFHGLTAHEGAQIASYIRTLNAPAPVYASPWNPPYQPGPGTDSRPVADWAAGAGLGAVLEKDSDSLAYLMPGGSTANWAANAYLNQREIPIEIQLPDWNHWLPRIHPLDAWGSSFLSSSWYQTYLTVRSQLVPNNPTVDVPQLEGLGTLQYWLGNENDFLQPMRTANMSDPAFQAKYYSSGLWGAVKYWEIEQQFGLEGMSQAIYGPQAPDRAWVHNIPFFTGPEVLGLPRPSPAVGNGLAVTQMYESFSWFQLQLVLNDGNGMPVVDWNYAMAYNTNDFTWNAFTQPVGPRVGAAGFLFEWLVKALQVDQLDAAQTPYQMVIFPGQVSWPIDVSAAQKVQLINNYLTVWFAKFGAYTQAQFFALPLAQPPSSNPAQMSFGSYLISSLPELRYQGADPTLLNQIAAWATTIWPSYNWSADLNATCYAGNLGQVFCQ